MLKAIGVNKLDRYHDHQKGYAERYGPRVWHLQYQGEVRMRQERAVYHKRRGAEEYRKSQATGKPCDYDPLRPWDYVWEAAVEDHYFWRREIEEPALLIVARTQSLESLIEGDVDIADQPSTPKRGKRKAGETDFPSHISTIGNETFSPLKKNKLGSADRFHNVANGSCTTNCRSL